MRRMFRTLSSAATAILLVLSSGAEAQSMKKTVEGVTNFTQVEATIACAGATKPSAIAALKTMGYKTVVNLRMASETGADLDAEAVAARAAGLQYVHLPFNTPASAGEDVSGTVREFLKVTSDPANRPLFVHCAGAGRAAAMWMIKRIVVDGWDEERAWKEALMTYDEPTSPALVWARGYARTFKR
jgi:uncharacterized protein (TIGR01244 family)